MTQHTHYNIFSTFAQTAERRGHNSAVIYLGTRYDYLKLKNLSERFAAALQDIGVRRGQRVMLYIPNGIQWVVSWLGIQRADAVCVPITPFTPPTI